MWMMRGMSRSTMSWWWRTARSFRLRRTNAAHRRPRRCCARPIRRSARPTPAHGQRQQAEHDDHDGDADHGGQDVADHVRQPLQRIVRQQRIPREAVGDVLRHIIQPPSRSWSPRHPIHPTHRRWPADRSATARLYGTGHVAEFHPLRRAVRACAGGRSARVAACATGCRRPHGGASNGG